MGATKRILHLGPDVGEPGGMASVMLSYRDANLGPWQVELIATYSATSRLRWLRRFASSVTAVALARRTRVSGVHLHVSERFDIIRSLVLLEIARRRRFPRIVTLHGADFLIEVRKRPHLVRAMLRRANAVTALSREVESAASELGAANVRFLPNPVRL